MNQATPAKPTMTPAATETVKLNDLPYWLNAHELKITSLRIVGEKDGQLWLKAETRSITAKDGDVTLAPTAWAQCGVTAAPSEASSQPRRGRRGG